VWDDGIIDRNLKRDFDGSREEMEKMLFQYIVAKADKPTEWQQWLACPDGSRKECTKAWGEESLEYALEYAYRNVDGSEIESGTVISEEYYQSRLSMVHERLAVAGVRLAATLAIALTGEFQPPFLSVSPS
jgi:hypothetical protein